MSKTTWRKVIVVTALLLQGVVHGYGQCFEDCLKRMSESKSPFAHLEILTQLTGCTAPQFNLETVDGEKIDLRDLKGTIVVLNFWFIGCAPCREEMPVLNKFVDQYSGEKIKFIGFNAIDSEKEISEKFMNKVSFKYKLIAAKNINNQYCVVPYPSHVVIDQAGVVKLAFFGPVTSPEYYSQLKVAIDSLLNR